MAICLWFVGTEKVPLFKVSFDLKLFTRTSDKIQLVKNCKRDKLTWDWLAVVPSIIWQYRQDGSDWKVSSQVQMVQWSRCPFEARGFGFDFGLSPLYNNKEWSRSSVQ